VKGRAFKFGNNISTDDIIPGRFAPLRSDLPQLAKHLFEDINPHFLSQIQPGDFIVAGRNFGLGSSREHAPLAIKVAGVGAVLAQSFARIFFRNAINVGLPVLICDTELIDEGDVLDIDLTGGTIHNLSKGVKLPMGRIPEVMVKIMEEGGIVPYIKKYGGFILIKEK